mmetsp:Transcript_9643/g.15522  ORF Transcript_9643/g.15522 Transcript_9643/m.15522 type:complete len:445 (+) Transcript_9643:33-1367(+)|eukprot:CAMPEP_0197031342 /NCGR_PEP_ID=MMETSP1384-20130603/10372_1 /TAXON_ID=29189 /ORGANISM="Ammonia sp." /LENGTH=444 /DNA_ID=CAMNT_0042460857 /DNA_START=32 /DNA_END=1366 /DNA_ORIENTATION=-
MAQQGDATEDEIEFDENDTKIIQLYEVINELMDEQKARVEDLEFLYNDKGTVALQNVEHRNNSVLNQIFSELQLKEKNDDNNDDDEENDSDSEGSEDEQDQGWEIYNTVVQNLNDYMGQIALFTDKMKEQKELIENMESPPQEDEIKELESVVEQQTLALEQTMKRNTDLESALSSVLNEYSNRITTGNEEIASLHEQLSVTNQQHTRQLEELRAMYEKKISELQKSTDSQYKEEVSQLIDSLTASRNDFQQQIMGLTHEMSEAQTSHHQEMLKLTEYNQALTDQLQKKTLLVEDLKKKQQENALSKLQTSMRKTRTALDIDDEEEFYYFKHPTSRDSSPTANGLSIDPRSQTLSAYNGGSKKTRTFTPSKYSRDNSPMQRHNGNESNNSSNNSMHHQANNHEQSSSNHQGGGGSSALQAKYAKYKNKSYTSRGNKSKYAQRGY